MSIKITGLQQAQEALRKELEKIQSGYVTVGIHEDAGMIPDGDISMAHLGAVQHYGADINHPGGTRYVIGEDGMAKFVSNSFTGPVSGVTQAHQIKIPPRPWLDVGVASGTKEYLAVIAEGVEKGLSSNTILNQIGVEAVGHVQQYIRDLKSPPNANSTKRKKGSDNPLIDTGSMMQSVKYTIANQAPTEGLE